MAVQDQRVRYRRRRRHIPEKDAGFSLGPFRISQPRIRHAFSAALYVLGAAFVVSLLLQCGEFPWPRDVR